MLGNHDSPVISIALFKEVVALTASLNIKPMSHNLQKITSFDHIKKLTLLLN